MAKIDRKHQKIFAGDVPSSNVVSKFGSKKLGVPEYSDDPDLIQTERYSEGWGSAVINNYAPCVQDLNALFFLITRQLAYLFQSGIPEWNTSTSYYVGSIVTDGVGGIYMSVSDTNQGNDVTVASKWTSLFSRKITTIGDNYTVNNTDWLILWSTGLPNVDHNTVSLPTPSAVNSGREIIVKAVSSTYLSNVVVKANDDSTIDGAASINFAQYTTKRLISDGTNWHVA